MRAQHVDAPRVATNVDVATPLSNVSAPSTAPLPTLAPTRRPVAPSASPAGAATAATVAPSPVATAAPSVAAGPRIVSVAVSPPIVHDGDTVRWEVKTSDDVTAVSAKVKVYAFNLQRLGPGRFELAFTIPHGVPGFFHGTYDLDLQARDAAGTVASRTVPVNFQ